MKKILSAILALCMIVSVTACSSENESSVPEEVKGSENRTMREMTTQELIEDMGLGINLGNTFESCGNWINKSSVTNYETAWGSPVITEQMIKGYKDCGFGVMRLPVAWSNMMDKETYTINPDYIARVKEVLNWALDSDLYVILNIHYDNGWFSDFADDKKRDECFKKYEAIWKQLCEEFGDYGDHLMFESLNEEGGWEELWNRYSNEGDKEKSYSILNEINQKFVDIVRASGKNNGKRHLLIAGYNTDIDLTCDELYKMPADPENRCAVSVHYYTPATFAILDKDASWGKAKTTWGSEADKKLLTKYMDMLKTTFVDKGIPVIIGEYGCTTKNKQAKYINLYLSSVCKESYSRGMLPVLWDVTDVFYDRTTCTFKDKDLLDGLMAAKETERNV